MDSEYIQKTAMMRMARRAGVRSMSKDCYNTAESTAVSSLEKVLLAALAIASCQGTKTIMPQHISEALRSQGHVRPVVQFGK